jgi:uncharacterized membrane protein
VRHFTADSFKTRLGVIAIVNLMAPFFVLTVLFVILFGCGLFGFPEHFGWWTSLRIALSGMFLLTASAHRGVRRPDLIRMIPSAFPRPDLLVTITGVLEVLGAIGMMFPATARIAAGALSVLLLAMVPANVRAAKLNLTIAGQRVPTLGVRTALQIVFELALLSIALG